VENRKFFPLLYDYNDLAEGVPVEFSDGGSFKIVMPYQMVGKF